MTKVSQKTTSQIVTDWLLTLPHCPQIIGINGPQGAGKTTLVEQCIQLLSHKGRRALGVSVDDFYLTYEEQTQLAKQNPGNPYLEFRGYPGTHDVPLGTQTLAALKAATAEQTIQVPRYNKSAYQGRGDRFPEASWTQAQGPFDFILFEGWMLGFATVGTEVLPQGFRPIHQALANYNQWNDLIDHFMMIHCQTPKVVVDWRIQAEQEKRSQGQPALSDEEIRDYVERFLPAYKVFSPTLYDHPKLDLIVEIDKERRLIESKRTPSKS